MDKIGIFSVPRSGSTWLGQIFNSHPYVNYKFQPNFAYSFPNYIKENATAEEIENFYKALKISNDPFVNGKLSISGTEIPEFEKRKHPSHLVFKETHHLNVIPALLENSDTKIIGLVRSPQACISSWMNIPKEFAPSWNIKDEWRFAPSKNKGEDRNYFGFEKWKEVASSFLSYRENYPERFHLIHYDTLLKSPQGAIQDLFEFCGLAFHEQTRKFIGESTSKHDFDDYSFYKKKTNDRAWEENLPKWIDKKIRQELENSPLKQFLK